MSTHAGFRAPLIQLPRPGIDLGRWATIACDQHTAEPRYWAQVEAQVGAAPSTLRLIFPEAYLGAADTPERISNIQSAMLSYLAQGLLYERSGAVLVERSIGGRLRRGLMLELDLEHYDYSADSQSLIRPTEGTIVARLAPRIAVRAEAALELPHILVLIDDPACTVIEPIAAERSTLAPLYEAELMLGGGHVAGFGVSASAMTRATETLAALAEPDAFAARCNVPRGSPPLLFAVGDGNHSLATAKAIWERTRSTVGMDHPSRYALVEVVNLHDRAITFSPIHRLLMGVQGDIRAALASASGEALRCEDVASAAAMQARVEGASADRPLVGVVGPGARCSVVQVRPPASGLVVDAVQRFAEALIAAGSATEIDYVHGDEALVRLAGVDGHAGIHLPALAKGALLGLVVRNGPLPRKAFSMGEAHEKRYYVEARRIR